ncbi:uncharacterized protein [Zea mays]|jgi:hypothetical protein|uniref:uncharacterized protein n=1 Tax=Zea mays TaxID=4577 RepID=UPI000221865E|nr:uncharacterized protein LOC103646825 [Zea mays]|eukprot:XP_008669695.1 uncharacterized protein LOC103646825 [Zea mays]
MAAGRVSPVSACPLRAWFLRARSSAPMACSCARLDFPAELGLMAGIRLRVRRSFLVLAHGRRCSPSCVAPDPAVCSPDRTLALLGHAACCACVCSVPAPKLQVCQSTARRQFAANVRSPVSPCVWPLHVGMARLRWPDVDLLFAMDSASTPHYSSPLWNSSACR